MRCIRRMRFAAMLTILVSIGCRAATRPAGVGDLSSSARRSEWRRSLQWTPACERAFSQTRDKDGTGNGIRTLRTSTGWQLVEVRCAQGAYQPSQEFIGISPAGTATPPLSLSVLAFDGNGNPQWSTAGEVWGTVTFDAARDEVTIVNASRGLGDCGSLVVYGIDVDSAITLTVRSARGKPCDDNSQAPRSWPLIQ